MLAATASLAVAIVVGHWADGNVVVQHNPTRSQRIVY